MLHLVIVRTPTVHVGYWREEVNLVGSMKAVIHIFEVVVGLSVLYNGVVQVLAGKGFAAVRRVHQAL